MLDTTLHHDLIVSAKDGDQGAFEKLVEWLSVPLLDYCCKRMDSYEDGRDALQDTWKIVWTSLDHFDSTRSGSFRPWVFQIATNQMRNLKRTWARAARRLSNVAEAHWRDRRQSPYTPLEVLLQSELRSILWIALGHLPSLSRAIVIAKLHGSLTNLELAAKLGIAPKTVWRHHKVAASEIEAALSRHGWYAARKGA